MPQERDAAFSRKFAGVHFRGNTPKRESFEKKESRSEPRK